MQVKKFGTYVSSWQEIILRFIISLGVSRGKSKRNFQFLWKKFVGNKSVGIYYNGLKLRVNPFGNTGALIVQFKTYIFLLAPIPTNIPITKNTFAIEYRRVHLC